MYFYKSACVFALALTLTITATTTTASILPFPPIPERDVSTMCASTKCHVGTVCRVVTACVSMGCFAHATCVPCVPEGVDAICNANGYIYTVLMIKPPRGPSPTSRLTPLVCDPALDNDKSGCPKGSVCSGFQQSKEVGTCCFGKPVLTPNPMPNHTTSAPNSFHSFPMAASNDDPICDDPSDLCGGEKCPVGLKCLPATTECGKASYRCLPLSKTGGCPPRPFSNPGMCAKVRVGHFCDNDSDCKGNKKCCKSLCGGRACLSPY